MTPFKPRYTGRFGHVNSLRTINILLLNHELLEFHELITTTDGMDLSDFFGVHFNMSVRNMLIVEATINMAQSLCTSAFEACHVKRLHVFRHKPFSAKILPACQSTLDDITITLLVESFETDGVRLMVEVGVRIDGLTTHTSLEMKMRRCGATSLSCKGNNVASLHLVANLHEILGIMAVIGLQTIVVANAHKVAITRLNTRINYLAIKCCKDVVSVSGLEVNACMAATTTFAVRTDDLCARQRISPPLY